MALTLSRRSLLTGNRFLRYSNFPFNSSSRFSNRLVTVTLGSEEEAMKKFYNVSSERYSGLQCEIDEKTSRRLEGVLDVLSVLPDSYVDAEIKDHGAYVSDGIKCLWLLGVPKNGFKRSALACRFGEFISYNQGYMHGRNNGFCTSVSIESVDTSSNASFSDFNDAISDLEKPCVDSNKDSMMAKTKVKSNGKQKCIDFTKLDISSLPTVLIIGRPNVGKSALFNRLIRRREALVYNTPTDHVTRDIREGVAKLSDLRFKILDSAGLEAEASSGSVLGRTAEMTKNVLARCQIALFLIDARDGLQPMDLDVGKWLRKRSPEMKIIVVMNKAESVDDGNGSLAAAAGEAHMLGFGEPIALSAETGLGMTELYETLKPLLEDYLIDVTKENSKEECREDGGSKLPLQLAIVGRPNVGKSTLLNTLLQEERVLVGPEAGLTRDSVRASFQYDERTIHLVDTAGWLGRTHQEKGPSSLSIMQSRKNLLRAHVIALVLDAEEVAEAWRSMTHAEVVIARRAVEEGRGLVVIVNKMDLLEGKLHEKVVKAVPEAVQTVIPQVTGIPVVFTSALEGRGRTAVMHEVVSTYEKWCMRLSTARLNRWLRKVMSRHSWKDSATQPKIKYFTQVKARPPTFVAFVSGKAKLTDTDMRFLTNSLKDDFDLGGIPVRIMQRSVVRNSESGNSKKKKGKTSQSVAKVVGRTLSDKRLPDVLFAEPDSYVDAENKDYGAELAVAEKFRRTLSGARSSRQKRYQGRTPA